MKLHIALLSACVVIGAAACGCAKQDFSDSNSADKTSAGQSGSAGAAGGKPAPVFTSVTTHARPKPGMAGAGGAPPVIGGDASGNATGQ
ncbi:MAG: hypothetical protein ABIY70_01015 [Capsulimonas sp.]|uniref:hypothetical protein n=1 Tax=Capsulimonas sp. TaxID=2494211 RepID=UPI00326591DA